MSELKPTTANGSAHQAYDTATEKVADSLRPVLDSLMGGVHEAVERLADTAAQAVSKMEQSGEYLKDSQARMVSGSRSYVRARPLTAIGVAVAGGFLLSWALRQR